LDLVRDWRNLHNRELHNLYFSSYLISDQIKKGGVSRERGMYRTKKKAHKISRGNSDIYHLEDLGIDGRTLK
jgi:hypothetical protein